MLHQWNYFCLILFTHSGEARTVEGGLPKRNQYAVMRYLIKTQKML